MWPNHAKVRKSSHPASQVGRKAAEETIFVVAKNDETEKLIMDGGSCHHCSP